MSKAFGVPLSNRKHAIPIRPIATASHFLNVQFSPFMNRAKKMVNRALELKTTAALDAFENIETAN